MADNHKDLVFEIIKAQTQLCYFLLGLAASAIAFTIHQTKDLTSAQVAWQIWLALACWGLSFGFGILAARFRIDASIGNANFLWMQKNVPTVLENDPETMKLIEKSKDSAKLKATFQGISMLFQQLAILAGAVAYVWGHILMMGKV